MAAAYGASVLVVPTGGLFAASSPEAFLKRKQKPKGPDVEKWLAPSRAYRRFAGVGVLAATVCSSSMVIAAPSPAGRPSEVTQGEIPRQDPLKYPPAAFMAVPSPEDKQARANQRQLGFGLAGGGYIAPGRFTVLDGMTLTIEATWRRAVNHRYRFELGAEGKFVRTGDTTQGGIGLPLRFVSGVRRYAEVDITIVPFFSRIGFDVTSFASINGFGVRLEMGFHFPLTSHFSLGVAPFAFGLMRSSEADSLFTYEPKVWMKVALL